MFCYLRVSSQRIHGGVARMGSPRRLQTDIAVTFKSRNVRFARIVPSRGARDLGCIANFGVYSCAVRNRFAARAASGCRMTPVGAPRPLQTGGFQQGGVQA